MRRHAWCAAGAILAIPLAASATNILNVETGELFTTIQAAHDDADTLDGHTLNVVVASHNEGIVTISKNLTLRSDAGATIHSTTDTSSSGDGRAWFLVQPNVGLHVENLTFDGTGNLIWQAFRHKGGGSFTNCHFRQIKFNPSTSYAGTAVAAFGADVDFYNCTFEEIGRVGVLYFGSVITGSHFEGNAYAGKGDGDFLDYCLDISNGARVFVHNNTVSDCRGVASSDGSTSAAFLVTTFFGPGTEAIFTSNTMLDNTTGIAVGFDGSDTSTVTANFNDFSGNATAIFSTAPAVAADRNWWGDATGPNDPAGTVQASPESCPSAADALNAGGLGDPVDDALITYCPWLLAPAASAPSPGGLVNVTKAGGDFVAGAGIAADNFTSAGNGDVSVWLKARNRDTGGSQPVAQSGNVYYINPDNHQQFDFQFTPSTSDIVGGGNYHLRLSVDLDPSAGTTGALCPGSAAAGSPVVIDLPLFDADADPANSWDDTDGFFVNPGGGAWSTDDVAYVYSQSWRMTFGFLNGALMCPGDYTIDWEVLDGPAGAPSRTSLAKTSIVMRVLDTPDVVPTHLNLATFQTCPGLSGNQLIVDVVMQQATDAVNGGQFFLDYDNTLLDFVSADPGLAPFTREIFESVDEIGGTIDYAVGVQDGSGPATADGRLARFTFDVGSPLPEFCSMSDLVTFRAHMPATQLSKPDATAVLAEEANLPAVEGDLTAPSLTVPSDISTPADAGLCSAAVDPGLAAATDACDAEPEIAFSRSDGKPDLLDPYDAADSPITITWSAEDDCGNMSFATQTVTVSATNELSVSVELAGVDPGPFTRCITFELFDCGNLPAAVVSAEMTFSGGTASDVIEVPCGNYSCITARDELHTLRRTDDDGDFTISGTQYLSDFTSTGTTDDSLTGGNVNDDFYIDILDFGGYAGQFSNNFGSANTTCATSPLHADFSGDGVVGVSDFSFVQINFLDVNEANCCGQPGAAAPPVERISVAELRARGDDDLAAGDINHDGWLDQDDLSRFLLRGFPCPADFNADGAINVLDLLLYLDHWFRHDPAADLTGDGPVDIFDLLAFLDAWFAGCDG